MLSNHLVGLKSAESKLVRAAVLRLPRPAGVKKCSATSWFPYRNGKIKHF